MAKLLRITSKTYCPPYYHPKGKFVVPVLEQQGDVAVNTHRGFSTAQQAEKWIDEHKHLVY